MAQKISMALRMPIEERRERWTAMIGKLRSTSVQSWFSDFTGELSQVRRAAVPIFERRVQHLPVRIERSLARAN
jgi:trehalose-6-phosphate synthase